VCVCVCVCACVRALLDGAIRQKLNIRTFTEWNASKAGRVTQNDVQDKESAVEMCVLHELGPTQLELHTCRDVMTSKTSFLPSMYHCDASFRDTCVWYCYSLNTLLRVL
jgi:hypothetical protein